MLQKYFDKVRQQLKQIESLELPNMLKAAEQVSRSIQSGGIIHLFGCGHSHLLTEDVFYRAGGLAPIHAILVEPLMLHEGAVRSSELERKNDYADNFMRDMDIRRGDVTFVLSTSGRNPVPVDVALIAKEKEAFVIGVTSLQYAKSMPSRHKSGKHLHDVVDLVIDNHSVKGDALLTHDKVTVPFGPSSTVAGASILHAIFAEAIRLMADAGFDPPVFLSGNIDGSDEHNQRLMDRYRERISLFS